VYDTSAATGPPKKDPTGAADKIIVNNININNKKY
jgi:hypothetical protein